VLFPGTAPGVPAYTVKVHAKFPDEIPAIRGVLCLHDLASGALLAVMDSTYLTAVRTGLAGALAAHVLARPDADVVAVIGAGVQGTHQLRSLATLRSLSRVHVYDVISSQAEAFARATMDALGLPVTVATSAADALRDAGVSLVATWSRTPFILSGMLSAGAHVTTLGADEPGKAEVDPELIKTSLFVCDDRALASELGALHGRTSGAWQRRCRTGRCAVWRPSRSNRKRPDHHLRRCGPGVSGHHRGLVALPSRDRPRDGEGDRVSRVRVRGMLRVTVLTRIDPLIALRTE